MSTHSVEDVYVRLSGLPDAAWRLTSARHVTRDVYELLGDIPDGESWEFQPGQFVICVEVDLTLGGCGLLATRLAA